MNVLGIVRKVLRREQDPSRLDHARAVDERRQLEQARAWERRGGPVDPGTSA